MEARLPLRFRIDQPHEAAVRIVKRALTEYDLHMPCELDVGGRLRQEVCASLVPCVVLFVDDPLLLLEAVMFYAPAALHIPQPVVISGNGHSTAVALRNREALAAAGLPAAILEPILRLHDRMTNAMDAIAIREYAYRSAAVEQRGQTAIDRNACSLSSFL